MSNPTSPPNTPLPPDVIDALQRGNKIEAIKHLRQHTGLGLKESKDLVDAAEVGVSKNRDLSPGQVSHSGASIWRWLLLIGLAALIYYGLKGAAR